jgi:sigma-B regulation protein RsbU (phosphoserine phosphatase)
MFKSITGKLIFFTLITVLPMVFAISFFSYKYASMLMLEKTNKEALNILINAENKINLKIQTVEKVPLNLSVNLPEKKTEILRFLQKSLKVNNDIFGMAVAFEPFVIAKETKRFCPYVFREKGEIKLTFLDSETYNYPEKDWYKIAKVNKKSVWSEPYFDEGGGNILMSTYSYPLFNEEGIFKGVITADVSLEDLRKLVKGIKVLKSGYAFLASSKGIIMASPNKSFFMKKSLSDIANDKDSLSLKNAVQSIYEKSYGNSNFSIGGKDFLLYHKRIESNGWYIGVVFPQQELMAPIKELNKILFAICMFGTVLILFFIAFISRKITGGLKVLTESATLIASGNFETKMPDNNSGDELGVLSFSFEKMRLSLIDYMENLKKTESLKQKIESELIIAKDIQMSILPKIFPPFPEREEIDIYAHMTPAREVGGDFYDFYFVDENQLCFLVGDVSDKGVPASLFMAVSKTLIKAVAMTGLNPGDILEKVNKDLCDGNDNCMFVTVFIVFLNLQTGELQYANAGHNPPVYNSNGKCDFIKDKPSPPLGAFEGATYKTYFKALMQNDALFLYTDGVTEAMSKDNRLFGEERLVDVLYSCNSDSYEVIKSIKKSIENFVEGAPQSDDITMLYLRWRN